MTASVLDMSTLHTPMGEAKRNGTARTGTNPPYEARNVSTRNKPNPNPTSWQRKYYANKYSKPLDKTLYT